MIEYLSTIIENIDLIKGVYLIYIVPKFIYYIYMYNASIREHIAENKEMYVMLKEIHEKVVKS